MAVGRPAPTSRAKVGPESTAPGCALEHLARDLMGGACHCRPRSPWSPRRRASGCDRRGASSVSSARRPGRHGHHDVAGARGGGGQRRVHRWCVWKSSVGQVAAIDALARHALELPRGAAPQPYGAAAARELHRERRAPGARAEHGNRRQALRRCTHGLAAASVGGLGSLLLVGGIDRIEVHRRQEELRKAALADQLRDRGARIGE